LGNSYYLSMVVCRSGFFPSSCGSCHFLYHARKLFKLEFIIEVACFEWICSKSQHGLGIVQKDKDIFGEKLFWIIPEIRYGCIGKWAASHTERGALFLLIRRAY
jgi:hypothetical protein